MILVKQVKTGWFWVVGFGDIFEGEKGERVKKLIVLQTFPPNPLFWFFALHDYKALKASNHLL